MNMYAETITRLRPVPTTDKYGNTVPGSWETAAELEIKGVDVQPDDSSESVGDRSTVVTGWRLFTPRGRDIDLLPTDRVEWQGITLEVEGEVARYKLAGRIHHVEARLKRVDG